MAEMNETQETEELEMRPGGRGGLLKTGNPGNKGGGRPPSTSKQRREEFLSGLMEMESATPDVFPTIEENVKGALRELVASKDAQTIRWLVEMQHGSPRSTVINEIENPEFVESVLAVVGEFVDPDQFDAITQRLAAMYEDKGARQ
jgi:hypothetical protein